MLTVVLSDIAAQLTYSTADIAAAAVKAGFGHKNVAKDFLTADASTTHITRGVNTMRRKCTTFILSKLPDSTKDGFLRGQKDFIQVMCWGRGGGGGLLGAVSRCVTVCHSVKPNGFWRLADYSAALVSGMVHASWNCKLEQVSHQV